MAHQMSDHQGKHTAPYWRFLAMLVLSFLAMYAFMYAMVNAWENVLPNFNQAYMAGLMTAPMAIFELLLMGRMYPNKKLNAILIAVAAVTLAVLWIFIRNQTAISDEQFLKSMIPHHAGAILMCEQTSLRDPDLLRLCDEIIAAQEKEIAVMKAELSERE